MKENLRLVGNFGFIVVLFLVLLSFAMFQGGFTSWFLFFAFLPIFFYHFGLLLYPIKKWKVTRHLSSHLIHAGDSVSVTVKIKRLVPFPLYYCICEEIFPDTLETVDNRKDKYQYMDDSGRLNIERKIKKVVFPSFRRTIELPYTLEQVPRGEHHLKGVRVRTGDIFGFVKKEFTFRIPDQLIVYPNERPVQMVEKVSSFDQGATASSVINLTNTNVASGIREYIPGDKFSWIDWKQTARKNEVMTKEFEQEKSTDILLVLDSCHYKDMNLLAFEAAIEVTVSLLETFRKQATHAGLLSVGEDVVHFPKHHDSTKKEWIRQYLTRIQPSGDRPFAVKLGEEIFKMGNGNIVIIVTTHLDETFRQTIQKLKTRTKKVRILLIQSSKLLFQHEHAIIQQLQFEGVGIIVLTEQQLMNNPIEVNGL
ncbi:DUF58 domain-containing protein [Virgibacillus ainsalahensis]